jgi:hypothetical protein
MTRYLITQTPCTTQYEKKCDYGYGNLEQEVNAAGDLQKVFEVAHVARGVSHCKSRYIKTREVFEVVCVSQTVILLLGIYIVDTPLIHEFVHMIAH